MRFKITTFAPLILAMAPGLAIAQTSIGRTQAFTNEQPWEVPGKTLKPGSYQMRVDDTMSDRSILQVLSRDGQEVLTTFIAVPNVTLHAVDSMPFVFWDQNRGNFVVRAWITGGDNGAREFVYEKSEAAKIATRVKEVVPAFDPSTEPKLSGKKLSAPDMRAVQLWALSLGTATPNKGSTINAVRLDRSRQQPAAGPSSGGATVPGSETARVALPAESKEAKLPTTASETPLIALVGLFALLCGLGLRLARVEK